MQPYRRDGYIFAFCAASAAIVSLATLVILGPASGVELVGITAGQAIIAGLCSFVLLRSNTMSRRIHLLVAASCVAASAAVLLGGWGVAAVFLAAPTISWAYNLRRVGA